MQHFTATFCRNAKLVTSIVAGLATFMLLLAPLLPDAPAIQPPIAVYILALTLFITWGFHPQSYTITQSTVIINRPFGNIKIPVDKIKDATQITSEDLGKPWRIMASGGVFGFFGVFSSKTIGKFTMWCRNRDSMVLMNLDEQIIIVSPDDPAGFIAAIRRSSA
jgi:hypothetical protein